MERNVFRKPRHYFDVAPRPSHVTFDDGREQRRNFPWMHYVEGHWGYAEPVSIKLLIGDVLVLITGHNLAPLFVAIEEHVLMRVRAQPELARDREHDPDSFVTEIRFLRPPSAPNKGQTELDLGFL